MLNDKYRIKEISFYDKYKEVIGVKINDIEKLQNIIISEIIITVKR